MKTKSTLIAAWGLALAFVPAALAGDSNAAFKQLDANNDGRVSHEEYLAGARAHFAKLDTNGDGIVKADELVAGGEKKSKLKFWEKDEPAARALTGRVGDSDRDGDGQITRGEAETGAEAAFSALDADKDDALSLQEMEAAGPKPEAGAQTGK